MTSTGQDFLGGLASNFGVDVGTFMKSLTANTPVGNTATGGAALQLENVDDIVNNSTLDPDLHFGVSKWLRANGLYLPARSMLYQVVRRTSVGSLWGRKGIAETAVAPQFDPDLGRVDWPLAVVQTGYSWGAITELLGSNIVQPMAGGRYTTRDEVQLAAVIRMMWIETFLLFYGNAAIDANEPDGLFAQMAADARTDTDYNIIDMRGEVPTIELLNQLAADIIEPKKASIDTFIGTPAVIQGLATEARAVVVQKQGTTNRGGHTISGLLFAGLKGAQEADLVPNIWFGEADKSVPTAASSTSAPSAPTIGSSAHSGTGSLFGAGDAGTYIHKIMAVGTNGHNSTVTTSAGTAVAEGESITRTLSDSGVTDVAYYEWWRSDKDGAASTCKHLGRYAKNPSGNTVLTDANAKIPGTSDAVMLSRRPDNGIQIRQIGDMIDIQIANTTIVKNQVIAKAYAPVVPNPHRIIWLKNCGKPSRTAIAV